MARDMQLQTRPDVSSRSGTDRRHRLRGSAAARPRRVRVVFGRMAVVKRIERPPTPLVQAISIARRLSSSALHRTEADSREDWRASPSSPVMLDAGAINRNAAGVAAIGLFMDLVMVVWLPSMRPFAFDADRLARTLNRRLPDRRYSTSELECLRPALATFFKSLEDGRWTPRAEYLARAADVLAVPKS